MQRVDLGGLTVGRIGLGAMGMSFGYTGAAMDDYHAGWWVPLIAALVSLLLVTLGIPAARRGERAAADDATNTATEGIAA